MKKEWKKTIIATVAAASVGFFGTYGILTLLDAKDKGVDDFVDLKPYEYVLIDGEHFGADMSVVCNSHKSLYDKAIRLNFKDDAPVVVDCDDNLEEREKKIVEKIVGYYNNLLLSINENYRFAIKTNDMEISEDDTVISISNNVVDGDHVHGLNTNSFSTQGPKEGIIVSSKIKIDWDEIKDEDDLYVYGIIFHEFSHALGLSDVYFLGDNSTTDYVDMTTVMHVGNGYSHMLYPNDYAILQALYSNEYKKHDNYEEAVRIVNEKIKKYTRAFYSEYANVLMEREGATNQLSNFDFSQNIEWEGRKSFLMQPKFSLKILEGNKCELVIKNDKGELLETCEGETLFVNGVLFVRNMVVKDASNYDIIYRGMGDVGMKLMLSIYVDNNSNLIIRDGEFNVFTAKEMDLEKTQGKKL